MISNLEPAPEKRIPFSEKKEIEPPFDPALSIKSEYPNAILQAIKAQYGKRLSIGTPIGFLGERIGFVTANDPNNPIQGVTSRVHGNYVHSGLNELTDETATISTGNIQEEFNVVTSFRLHDHTFFDDSRTAGLISELQSLGYRSTVRQIENGNRVLVIETSVGSFDLGIGWSSAENLLNWCQQECNQREKDYPAIAQSFVRQIDELKQRRDPCLVDLSITNQHPKFSPPGVPLLSEEQVLGYLETSRVLAEKVAAVLVKILGNGVKFSELKMDWLPPNAISTMNTAMSSAVEGRVEPTVAVEAIVEESFGLERLVGLAPETLASLSRIVARLKEPSRAKFLKKHGFLQSNGAVFWGAPGTGKTLAGQAIAEAAGCLWVVLKVDEYMTSYIHDSARRLGDAIRDQKIDAAGDQRPTVIQIDEADSLLRPVSNTGSVSDRDASEIRAVLLREFQEPSNVFFILTTNLDPRDAKEADPAIVRNQRIGEIVSFCLPAEQGRLEIFQKEITRRSGSDLRWVDVDFAVLATSTEGFSPADIQEVLSVAVNGGYDSSANTATVNQQQLIEAVSQIKGRKMIEERIRRPIGFH